MTAKVVTIANIVQQNVVYRALAYRRDFRGRTLMVDMPDLGLQAGARLEPFEEMLDVSKFEHLRPPFKAKFWIGSPNGRVLHDSPVLSLPGVSINKYSGDVLHGWHLGPLANFLGLVMWFFLDSKIFAPNCSSLEASEVTRLSVQHIRAELWVYYKDLRRTNLDFAKKGSEATHSQ